MVKKIVEVAHKHVKSQENAWSGLLLIFLSQANFRIELAVTLLVIGAGIYFGIGLIEWYGVLFSITLVLISEALNSALESACDAITTQRHGAIKYAKDVAAGAVLLSGMCSIAVGLLVFWPHISALFVK